MRRSLAGLWLFGLAAVASALTTAGPRAETTDVTFARDVAPIVFENCVYCHRPGEVAPFSLLTYKDARPWARSIKQKVSGKQMPPSKADSHFGEFQNAKVLGDRDIQTIVAWVDGGAKEGDPADLPSPPHFSEGWQIGTPDLALRMAEPFKIAATGDIPWVTVPSNDYVFPQDTWLQAIEVRPGNRAVVHHAVANPNASVAWGQQIWEEMHSTYVTWTAVTERNVNDTEPIQIPANKAFTTGVSARR